MSKKTPSISLNVVELRVMHVVKKFRVYSVILIWLRAGRSVDQILIRERFSAPVQTGSGAHPAPCTIGTGSFPGVKSGRAVTLTPHPLLVPWSRKSRILPPGDNPIAVNKYIIPLLPLGAVRPVQSLSACTVEL
jgi:hypothetical protein